MVLCCFFQLKTCLQQFSDDLDTSSSLPMLNTSCESEEEELGSGGVLNDSGSDSGISNISNLSNRASKGQVGFASNGSPTFLQACTPSFVSNSVSLSLQPSNITSHTAFSSETVTQKYENANCNKKPSNIYDTFVFLLKTTTTKQLSTTEKEIVCANK